LIEWTPDFAALCTIELELGAPMELQAGPSPERFIPVLGGTVSGVRLSGEVLPRGGDRQSDHGAYATIDATQIIKTRDGALIAFENRGIRVASPEIKKALRAGEDVPFKDYYMRFACTLRSADPRYHWLNERLFVAAGAKRPDCVALSVFELL
jgi:hypothetical protein